MRLGRWVSLALLIAVFGTSVGCEGLKRKFIRKPKVARQTEPIFALEKAYRPEQPPEIRYQAHFAYWKAAHDDLLWGMERATRARRLSAARQAIKELRAMQALLEGPPAGSVGTLIDALTVVETQLASPTLSPSRLATMRSTLEALRRRIDKGYDYHKIKAHVKPDPPTPPPGATVTGDEP